jgi:hypothetical protein
MKRGSTRRKSLLTIAGEHEGAKTSEQLTQLNNDMIYIALNLAYLPDEAISLLNFDFR